MSAKYINNLGQILESKAGNLRVELNGSQMRALIEQLEAFGQQHYKGKSPEEIQALDRSREFQRFTLNLGKAHENAPSFVKGDLFVVVNE